MNAEEFLKRLHHLDEVFVLHDDAEYNERQLTQFAERYHKEKDFWDDDKIIEFVNWYIKLHELDFKYTLENRTIIDDFKEDHKEK